MHFSCPIILKFHKEHSNADAILCKNQINGQLEKIICKPYYRKIQFSLSMYRFPSLQQFHVYGLDVDHVPSKMSDEIIYPFPNCSGAAFEIS